MRSLKPPDLLGLLHFDLQRPVPLPDPPTPQGCWEEHRRKGFVKGLGKPSSGHCLKLKTVSGNGSVGLSLSRMLDQRRGPESNAKSVGSSQASSGDF